MKLSDIPEQEIIDACNGFHADDKKVILSVLVGGFKEVLAMESKLSPDIALSHKYPSKLILKKNGEDGRKRNIKLWSKP